MGNVPKAVQAWSWPQSLDALIAAPDHHKLLLENEEVRVLEVRIPAGAKVPLHTHCWSSVLYVMQWADIIRRDEHGNQVLDTRRMGPEAKRAGASWCPPYAPHSIENVDKKGFLGIAVELKTTL
jgi:hypothetical protein